MLAVLVLSRGRGAALVAAVLLVVGAATDGLDGYLARRYASATRTGAWLDPLADKLLVLAPLLALTATDRFPAWAAAVIAAREVAVSLLRARLGRRGRSLPATPLGKWKTVAQMLAILLYLLPLDPGLGALRAAALAVAVVLTVWSGLDYAMAVRR